MLQRPPACRGCSLDDNASGFVLPEGPTTAPLLFLGESAGATEVATGRPFVGDAGSMLQRLFNLLGWDRSAVRIANTVSCRPPNDWMGGTPQAPWFHSSIAHCAVHREPVLAEGHPVVVALGATALKTALGLLDARKIRVEDFHGTVTRDPTDRFWVVPTFHPSFLQRGAHNLIGTVLWDLQQARTAATAGRPADTGSLVVDPPLDWFSAWVDQVLAAVAQDRAAYPLSVDIETPDKAHGKDEGEISAEDRSFTITRVNLACHQDEGITVPFVGPYIDALTRLLAGGMPLWLWNKEYDLPRLRAAGVTTPGHDARALDLMWLWHVLQSDLPRGLGFVAPFYSTFGPWKHLADADPGRYGAIDGLQTHRVGFGVLADLQRQGLAETALRHVHRLHHCALKPAQQVGVKIDRERLLLFKADLGEKATVALQDLQQFFPDECRNLSPKGGLTKRPADNVLHVKASAFTRKGKKRKGKDVSEIKLDLYKQAVVVARDLHREVWVCRTCGATEVQRRHRCPDRSVAPDLYLDTRPVTRYFWSEPFNPDSWQQVLAYIHHQHHLPGKAKKTRKDTTDRETLVRLAKTTGDRFYNRLLDYRAVQKVKGTYVDGTERRLDEDDRIHPEPTFKPSTMRLSYVNPNITNVIQDKGGSESLAAGFRRCVVASPGCRLLEVDFAGSEAVDVGWLCGDPGYIRLAKLGVHAGLTSHLLGQPYDLSWSDADLGAYFRSIKQAEDQTIKITYDRAKHFVHGYSYGLTLPGMVLQFPELFPTRKIAEQYADLFETMAPKVPAWQRATRELAFKQHYLGGAGAHPFGYKHWFWSVFTYKKILPAQYHRILQETRRRGKDEASAPVAVINGQYFKVGLGEDGKRCIAFMPQSITAGKLKTKMLALFDPESPTYIGETYFGKTPLRAPIHDSLLLEIPKTDFDWVATIVCNVMQQPVLEMPCPASWGLGMHLATGVSAKTGLDWQHMEELKIADVGVGTDTVITGAEAADEEDLSDLERRGVA